MIVDLLRAARERVWQLEDENRRLRERLKAAEAHRCPAPEWYPKVRGLLGDVALAAAFTGTDLAELPAHVAKLRAKTRLQQSIARLEGCPGWCPCGVELGDDDLPVIDVEFTVEDE